MKKEDTSSCSTAVQKKLRENELDKSFYRSNCASACDCTGAVVAGQKNKEGLEHYDETFHFEPVPAKKETEKTD